MKIIRKLRGKERENDNWEVVRADNITVAQGYKCRFCGLIYGNTQQEHCKAPKRSLRTNNK